jgi:biopolymer transport protein TolR
MAMATGARAPARRGRRRGRRSLMSEINVTPFVDVMLVLLIIFMVAAPLLTVGVPVDLPETDARAMDAEQEPLTITVTSDGQIYLQDTAVPFADLVPRLAAIAQEGYRQRIFIRADAAADYGVVAQVMARVNRAGYANLGLVTDPAAGAPVASAAPVTAPPPAPAADVAPAGTP